METTPNSTNTIRRAMRLLVVLASAACAPANTVADSSLTIEDKRPERLEAFFQSFGCPAPHHVKEYVGTADNFAIDYRLLPAISVLESTCGVHQRLNNRWGWDSARKGFASFRAGLEYIARQLAEGRYYKGKTLEEKVRMYNPKPEYAVQLKKLMRKIDDRIIVPVQDAALVLAPQGNQSD
jgi:hypothetical protein